MSEKRAASFVAHHEHSSKDDFRTPAYLFEWIDRKFGPVEYDAACFADGSNALATPLRLEDEWPEGSVVYSNPPWGAKEIEAWFDKGVEHMKNGGIHLMLVPNKLCQTWFASRIQYVSQVWCLGGRVNFEGPYSTPGGASRQGTVLLVCDGFNFKFGHIVPTKLYSVNLRDLK